MMLLPLRGLVLVVLAVVLVVLVVVLGDSRLS